LINGGDYKESGIEDEDESSESVPKKGNKFLAEVEATRKE